MTSICAEESAIIVQDNKPSLIGEVFFFLKMAVAMVATLFLVVSAYI